MSFTCKVAGCRYEKEHLTERHCCGKCKLNGHGQIECNNDELIKELKKFKDHNIKFHCNVKDCIDPHTHTTKGHSCLYCDNRLGQHLRYCSLNKIYNNENCDSNNYSNHDNIENFDKDFTKEVREVKLNIFEYKNIYAGMGCFWYVRNIDGNNENNQYLFMHNDNWGQYGEDTSHLPRYKAFIYGYTLVN